MPVVLIYGPTLRDMLAICTLLIASSDRFNPFDRSQELNENFARQTRPLGSSVCLLYPGDWNRSVLTRSNKVLGS